jgi:hypothetical protein
MDAFKRARPSYGFVLIDFVLLALLTTGCGKTAATQTASVSKPSTPSSTPTSPPTATLPPIQEIVPPTPFPLPATTDAEQPPATITVCRSGCDYTTIQDALDGADTGNGTIIEIQDSLHTESGITVQKDVTIRGQEVRGTIVQAHLNSDDAPDRVFLIERGATVILKAMTIQHGKPAVEEGKGGGIRNFGALTLQNCVVRDNRANGGGGIGNSGDLTLINSSVHGNVADGVGPMGLECGNGGGIQCGSGTLLLINSTVNGNQAGYKGRARGGGLHIGCGCKATLINSTISGNRASRESGRAYNHGHSLGGGIYVMGELQLINSTISHNHADGEGGGIFIRQRMDYLYTIVANNTGDGGNCVAVGSDAETRAERIGTNIGNLVEDGSCGSAFDGDPMLGPLTDNGGFTETHALLQGSPAIDALPSNHCYLSTDQRELPRPATTDDEQLCDIGAFEYQP